MTTLHKILTLAGDHRTQSVVEFSRSSNARTTVFYGRGGLLQTQWITPLLQRSDAQHFVIMDKNIERLYGKKFLSFLRVNQLRVKSIIIAPGERSKSLTTYKRLISSIIVSGVDRDSHIIAFGGGVVNNIAGFVASTLYRGIGLIQVPTTLLAQLDATIDFKQAINSPFSKNHLGSYYSASAVVVDSDLLQTLPIRQLRSGFGEAIKHALVQDRELFSYLESYAGEIRDQEFLNAVIIRTIQLKISLLKKSHEDSDVEMLPQYGHAIGHALEHLSHYKLLHGEVIAIGMCIMSEVAHMLGISSREVMRQHYQIMSKFRLPTIVPNYISDQSILSAIRHDKYFLRSLRSVLASEIGSVASVSGNHGKYVFNVESDLLRKCLNRNRNKVSISPPEKIWMQKN